MDKQSCRHEPLSSEVLEPQRTGIDSSICFYNRIHRSRCSRIGHHPACPSSSARTSRSAHWLARYRRRPVCLSDCALLGDVQTDAWTVGQTGSQTRRERQTRSPVHTQRDRSLCSVHFPETLSFVRWFVGFSLSLGGDVDDDASSENTLLHSMENDSSFFKLAPLALEHNGENRSALRNKRLDSGKTTDTPFRFGTIPPFVAPH